MPPGDARCTATSRAPRLCFAHQSAGLSLRGATRRTCTTPLKSSARTRAPRRWVCTPMRGPGSLYEAATSCALRSSALITPQPRWFSPGSALTCPSSCITAHRQGSARSRLACRLGWADASLRERLAQRRPSYARRSGPRFLWAGKGIKSTSCISIVIRRPQATGPKGPSGCGAVAVSEYIPRSCRAGATGDGRCTRFQYCNTGCKAADDLLDIRDFCII